MPTLFSPFPHGTFLHYRWIKIFRIRRWFSYFQTKFHMFCFTLFFFFINLIYRTFTLFYIGIPPLFKKFIKKNFLFHVHSPLLTKSLLIFFFLATKMFQFTKFFIYYFFIVNIVSFKKIISYILYIFYLIFKNNIINYYIFFLILINIYDIKYIKYFSYLYMLILFHLHVLNYNLIYLKLKLVMKLA